MILPTIHKALRMRLRRLQDRKDILIWQTGIYCSLILKQIIFFSIYCLCPFARGMVDGPLTRSSPLASPSSYPDTFLAPPPWPRLCPHLRRWCGCLAGRSCWPLGPRRIALASGECTRRGELAGDYRSDGIGKSCPSVRLWNTTQSND